MDVWGRRKCITLCSTHWSQLLSDYDFWFILLTQRPSEDVNSLNCWIFYFLRMAHLWTLRYWSQHSPEPTGWMNGRKGREERERRKKGEEGKKGKEPSKAQWAEGSRQTALPQTARGRKLKRNLRNSPTWGKQRNFSEVLPSKPTRCPVSMQHSLYPLLFCTFLRVLCLVLCIITTTGCK